MHNTTSDPGPAQVADDATTRLQQLLDAELAYDPVARGGYINHLAMSLVAAWRLGATADELDAWFGAQTTGDFLVPRDPPAWLGRDTARVEQRGIDAEVRDRLPALVGSPGTQFFHAIIRLEHAVDAGHAGQVANALRNWEDHADEPGEPALRDDGRSSAEVLREVADTAVRSYLNRPNIGTLHLVTGTRAARSLVALLEEPAAVELALATARAVDELGGSAPARPGSGTRLSPGLPDWRPIVRAALNSHDPHVVKLVHSSRWELERTGDLLQHQAAAVATGLG